MTAYRSTSEITNNESNNASHNQSLTFSNPQKCASTSIVHSQPYGVIAWSGPSHMREIFCLQGSKSNVRTIEVAGERLCSPAQLKRWEAPWKLLMQDRYFGVWRQTSTSSSRVSIFWCHAIYLRSPNPFRLRSMGGLRGDNRGRIAKLFLQQWDVQHCWAMRGLKLSWKDKQATGRVQYCSLQTIKYTSGHVHMLSFRGRWRWGDVERYVRGC